MLGNLFIITVNSYEFFLLKNYLKITRDKLQERKHIFDIQYFNDQSSSFKIPLQDFDFHESNFYRSEKLTFYF